MNDHSGLLHFLTGYVSSERIAEVSFVQTRGTFRRAGACRQPIGMPPIAFEQSTGFYGADECLRSEVWLDNCRNLSATGRVAAPATCR